MNKKCTQIIINTDYITLGQFLKFADIIYSGGEAKQFLSENEVYIDGELDTRRGRKLCGGERISVIGLNFEIIKK